MTSEVNLSSPFLIQQTPRTMKYRKRCLLLLVVVGYACLFCWQYFYSGSVFHGVEPTARRRSQPVAPVPVPLNQVIGEKYGDIGRPLNTPGTSLVPTKRGPEEYVSSLNISWMKWPDVLKPPGIYRGCVPRPKEASMAKVVTGGLVEQSSEMTIPRCLGRCIALNFTYAVLSRGTECFCSVVRGESPLLTYTENTHCDIPCSGQPRHHCGGKEFMSLYRTSVPDARCPLGRLKPKGSLPLIALASYPRSGNTWTRFLIERATGLTTSTIFPGEGKRKNSSFLGATVDWKSQRAICVKTHHKDLDHIRTFEAGVLLIRNPYRVLVTQMIWKNTSGKDHPSEALKYFNSRDWLVFVNYAAKRWRDMAIQWIEHSPRIHVTHYENLQRNTYEELAEIVRFLGVPVRKQRLLCAVQEELAYPSKGISQGNHGGSTRPYLTKDPFTADMRELIDRCIKEVNETLQKHSLTPLPGGYSVKVF